LKVKKEFDPRTDKMLDIDVDEDFLMDSLKNFKPPEDNSFHNKSQLTALDGLGLTRQTEVLAGVKLRNMVDEGRDF